MTWVYRTKYTTVRPTALARAAAGQSYARIDRDLGLPDGTTRHWARKAGLSRGPRRPRPRASTERNLARIAELVLAGGMTITDIAAQVGVSRSMVYRVMERLPSMGTHLSTQAVAPGVVGAGRRLGITERMAIAAGLRDGASQRAIAVLIHRSQSTVSREISRNTINGVYDPLAAHDVSLTRLARPKKRKLDDNRTLRGLGGCIAQLWCLTAANQPQAAPAVGQ